MPPNRYSTYMHGANAPALGSFVVTPSDTVDLPEVIRAVTIGGTGTIAWIGADGESYATGQLPVGTYTMQAARILTTGTSATQITAWV